MMVFVRPFPLFLGLILLTLEVTGANGYHRLCTLKNEPIVHVQKVSDGRYIPVNSTDNTATNETTTNNDNDNFRRNLGKEEVSNPSPISSYEPAETNAPSDTTFEARACPCRPTHYCFVTDGDTCGIPRNEDDGSVACLHLDSQTVFIRNAWPVVVLWYAALFIFLLSTENGKHARDFLLSFVWKQRYRNIATRMVDHEIEVRERMRATVRAQQRRLMSAQNERRRNGNEDDGPLVLKTKLFLSPSSSSSQDTPTTADHEGVGDDSAVDEKCLQTPPRNSAGSRNHAIEDDDDGECGQSKGCELAPSPPDTPETEASLQSSFDDSHAEEDDDDEIVCTVCLDVVEEGDRVGVLKCDHIFHADCLKMWLRRRNVCPLCQSPDIASPRRRRRQRQSDNDEVNSNRSGLEISQEQHRRSLSDPFSFGVPEGDISGAVRSVAIRLGNDDTSRGFRTYSNTQTNRPIRYTMPRTRGLYR